MQNTRNISELVKGGKALSELRARSAERARMLDHVRALLPQRLGEAVLTAGLEGERLTVGVAAAVWASRLRYHAGDLREALSARLSAPVSSVRIRIIPSAP